MEPSCEQFDTIIVGSGLAGLSAARKLSLSGQKVLVLERAKYLGGHLMPFQRYGWPFEVGVHYIADTAPGSLWANALQDINASVPVTRLDEAFERTFEEGSREPDFCHLSDLDAWLQQCRERWPEHAGAWQRYAEDLELVWRLGYQLQFPIELPQVFKLIPRFKFTEAWRLLRLVTVSAEDYFLRDLGLTADIYRKLSIQHLIIGCPMDSLSGLLFLLINRYYLEQACAVDGGGLGLRDALLAEMDFATRTEAEVLHIEPQRVAQARFKLSTQSEQFYARNIIWTPDPRILQEIYQGQLGWLTRTRLKQVKDSHCLVVGYFATRQALPEYGFANSNDWLLGTATPNENYQSSDVVELAQHSVLYISTSSIRDAADFQQQLKTAKKQCGGIFQVMYLVPPDASLWGGDDPDHYRYKEQQHAQGFRKAYLEKKAAILDVMRQRLFTHYPALENEGELVWQEIGTPLTHRRYLNSPGMNGYGYQPSRLDLLVTRPSWRTGVPGLYLSGSFLRPAHGLSAALFNGVGVAKRILGES